MAPITGPSSLLAVVPGSSLSGAILVPPPPYLILTSDVVASIFVPVDLERLAFQMPNFFDLLPTCAQLQDQELVKSGDIPAYYWDSVPDWDTAPFKWDEVIGPQTILRTTMRIIQLDMERQLKDIQNAADLYDLRRVGKEYLPYHAAMLGTPLPGAEEEQQRAFLKELVATYKKKGTPLSFVRLFNQLGFDLTLRENYHRKKDGEFLQGPQIAMKSNALIIDEPIGTVVLGQVRYRLQTISNPITRGTLKIEIFDQSVTAPTVIVDNGNGGWSDNIIGIVDYNRGYLDFTLPITPILNGQPITASYDHRVDAFPDLETNRFKDRVRSSVVQFAITPKNANTSLTEEIIDRIELYLQLLKPAHVIIRNLDLILNLSDEEETDDSLNPFAMQFVESLFGTLYLGMGWAATDNGSRDPDSATFPQNQHRSGREFLTSNNFYNGETPYVYPFLSNGKFTQPNAGNDFEADWFETKVVFSSTVTADTTPTTTDVSIVKGAGTALGVGDHLVIVDGPAGGESRIIQTFVDQITYYDVTVSPAYSVSPAVGNQVRVVDVDGVNLRNLQTGFRQQDPLDVYYGYPPAVPPDGLETSFSFTISIAPLLAGSTSFLRFTIGLTDYEETATATGPFSNTNAQISISDINYTTGVVTVTFSTAPDVGSVMLVLAVNSASADVGEF